MIRTLAFSFSKHSTTSIAFWRHCLGFTTNISILTPQVKGQGSTYTQRGHLMMSNQPQLSSEDNHFTSETQKSVVFSVWTKKRRCE